MRIGHRYAGNGRSDFTVWAPFARTVELVLAEPGNVMVPMNRDSSGYWHASGVSADPGTLYRYRLDGERDRPDPASHAQHDGVHGPSIVIDHTAFSWSDADWKGIGLKDLVIYELHVGTFTEQGIFDAVISRIDDLKDLGITAIELMPVAQFPGERNWGYDGVYPFAVQTSYGGPDGLKRLVDACHARGMAIILDVVYNHLGPEGNYLWDFGPYFTDTYKTPWGMAINFDGPFSDEVKNFFYENARHWFLHYHIDGLRLDAVHAIYDAGALPFLQELADLKASWEREARRNFLLIAETDRNDPRLIRPFSLGGYGIDAQWSDDFHHALHTLLTGEKTGYYEDFGDLASLDRVFREGFAYNGNYSSYRRRRHGGSAADRDGWQFVVAAQNHDQVGNRMLGERLSSLVSFEALKLAAGTVLLSPFIPLIFMGEEYGETAPFLYFVNHSDPALISAVREGRKEEFKAFSWQGEPPDPQGESTFRGSKLNWALRAQTHHRALLNIHTELLGLRKRVPSLAPATAGTVRTRMIPENGMLCVFRQADRERTLCVYNFSSEERSIAGLLPHGRWTLLIDSADRRWQGPGSLLPAEITIQEKTGELRMHGMSCVAFHGAPED